MAFKKIPDQKHPENSAEYPALKVNAGISAPSEINPALKSQLIQKSKRKEKTAAELFEGIISGNRSMLSQAITVIESALPRHEETAREIIASCLPFSGNSIRIGITGVPGVGKSSFIEEFGNLIVEQEHKLAVLAIDPSSERSRGSILGDKTRMEKLSVHPDAFIRPSPSGGSLGGVARKTRETVILCEAAGYDVIFIETVGVGQSETAVHSMVDFFLLLMLAGAGDELQGIKRGIMEMADGIAITKADGTNQQKAMLAKQQCENALHLFPISDSGWLPKVEICSALTNLNINNIWEMISEFRIHVTQNSYFEIKRQNQAKFWMYESINQALHQSFFYKKEVIENLGFLEIAVKEGRTSPFEAAKRLLEIYNTAK
jgi:LAO/AO transport system kinase